jgi:hypothetical protein
MAGAEIWWDAADKRTPELINRLGGRTVVESAVAAVLPGRTVKLRVLTPGISGSVVFLASPETAYKMRRVSEVDGVLKVGPARLLADELERYNRWVAHVLAHASHFASLDAPYNLASIAQQRPENIHALHYRHVGHTTFGARAKDLIAADDGAALCRLIDAVLTILRPWQEMVDPVTGKSLTSEGVYSFGSDPFEEYEAMCGRLNAESVVDDSDRIDPAVFRHVKDLWHGDALGSERQLQTILHGDLHIDNILVDASDSPTLIDFGATGEGHFLRDLSTLEAHLVLRGLAPEGERVGAVHRKHMADLQLLYSAQAFLEPAMQLGYTPLITAVARLRRYALYCLMNGDASYMPQYAMGVLRHAIRICTRPDAAYTNAQRWASARVTTMLHGILAIENHRLVIRDSESRHIANGLAFLNDPPLESADPNGVNAPSIEPCTAGQWEALANALRSVRRVDLIGITPTPLISAMLSTWQADSTTAALPQLRYVTLPAPSGSRVGGLPHPNWRVALTGMRNVATMLMKSQIPMDRFAQVTDTVTTNCVVRAVTSDGGSSIYFAGQVCGAGLADNAYTLSVLPDTNGWVSDMFETTFQKAEPFIIREVDCLPLQASLAGADGDFMHAQAFRLALYGDPTPRTRCLRPIALTILRTRGPGGRQALVKIRSPLVDYDDFGKVSFLSTRILAHDVARAYGHDLEPAEDAEDAFLELWESIGSPDPFILAEKVFIQAAKRDVYETTLLELAADRFTKRGFLIMSREDSDVQLGFAVLTVDLEPGEVKAARRAGQAIEDPNGPLLRVVRVNDLLSGRYPVNRIMRERKDWLLENCLGPYVD